MPSSRPLYLLLTGTFDYILLKTKQLQSYKFFFSKEISDYRFLFILMQQFSSQQIHHFHMSQEYRQATIHTWPRFNKKKNYHLENEYFKVQNATVSIKYTRASLITCYQHESSSQNTAIIKTQLPQAKSYFIRGRIMIAQWTMSLWKVPSSILDNGRWQCTIIITDASIQISIRHIFKCFVLNY